ncbi:hypothetical protein SDC9_71031 [bioreactor metagenome]|uniref:Uncharacterized protein n=1 Tax=bioreactor metagenome TaxID=1076179 RepID=A0A644Y9E4_9ZZZZ
MQTVPGSVGDFLRLAKVLTECFYANLLDFLLDDGFVADAGYAGGNGVHNAHALDDHAERAVVLVEVFCVRVQNKELAARRVIRVLGIVRIALTRHADHAAVVRERIMEAVVGKLALDAVTGSAGAGACRVAALNDEALDDAVEDGPVVITLVGKGDEVADGIRRDVLIQFDFDDAAGLHFDGGNGYFGNQLNVLL